MLEIFKLVSIYFISYVFIGGVAIYCTHRWSKDLYSYIEKYKTKIDESHEEKLGKPTRIWWIPFFVGRTPTYRNICGFTQ